MILNSKLEEVSPGYFDIGNGVLATLEQIVQLRTGRRSTGMNVNCPEGVPPTKNPMRIVNMNNPHSQQEHLPLPSTLQRNESEPPCECTCGGHTTTYKHTTRQQSVQTNDEEHLPLPVMNYRKSEPQMQSTANESEQHLVPPSTQRRRK